MDTPRIVVGTKGCAIKDVWGIIAKCTVLYDKWSDFARHLGIGSMEIKELTRKRMPGVSTHSDVIYEILEEWVTSSGNDATLAVLLHVVEEECHAVALGESLRHHFHLPTKLSMATSTPLGSMTPEIPTYYIPRTLITRNIISHHIFQSNSPDVFLIEGMDRSELRKLVKDKLTGDSKEQIACTKIEPRFIILNQRNHFDKICEKIDKPKPVHYLRKEGDGRLRWIRSHGDITYLQGCIDRSQDELGEVDFCHTLAGQRAPVCISDSPGMGKSLLLAKIGGRLREIFPGRKVSFIPLTSFIKQLKQLGIDNMIRSTAGVLRNLFRRTFPYSGLEIKREDISFELLLDGFDELDSQEHQLAYDLLKTIQHSFPSIRLWVTSRPHLLAELEFHLNQLGYNIRAFQLDDQIQFLSSFWFRQSKSTGGSTLNEEKCQRFAKCCLDALKSKMNSADQDIAGIPLQCLLIGVSYSDDAMDYARLDNPNDTLAAADIDIGTISNLYRSLIKKKIQKYQGEEESVEIGAKLNERELMTIHAKLGWALIFPDHVDELEQLSSPVGESEMDHVLKVGILESSSTLQAPRFLHRTFAEYFIAWLVVDELERKKSSRDGLPICFLRALNCQNHIEMRLDRLGSFRFTHPVITYFIDSIISQSLTFSGHPDIQLPSSDHTIRIAHSCINANYVQLFTQLLSLKAFDKQASEIFDDNFLFLAICSSSLELVKPVLHLFEKYHEFHSPTQIQALITATKHNKFSILEYLLVERNLQELVKESQGGSSELIHDCVENTKNNSDLEIKEAKRVLLLLVDINRSLLECKGGVWEEKPLLSFGVHIHLLKELVTLGVDVLAQDIQGNTVLHMNYNRNHLSSKDYDELVQIIGKGDLQKLVLLKGEGEDTPLMSTLRWIDPSQETLQTFKEAGSSFKSIDENGDSVLEIAIRNGRVTTKLIGFGAKINRKPLKWLTGKLGRQNKLKGRKTLLHHAAQTGNFQAVQLLLEDKRMDANLKDEDGLTPLDLAVRSWKKLGNYSETALSIQNRGGSLTSHVNGEGKYLLHEAVEMSDIQLVQLLISLGLDVNFQDSKGNTTLHILTNYRQVYYPKTDNFLIFQSLLENGANPKILNGEGKCPLNILFRDEKSRKLVLFLSHILAKAQVSNPIINVFMKTAMSSEIMWDSKHALLLAQDIVNSESGVNYQDSKGNSLMHVVAEMGMKSVVTFLISSGADVNLANNEKETPLHLAATYEEKPVSLELIQTLIENGADPYAVAHSESMERRLSFLHLYIGINPSPSEFHQMAEYLISNGLADLFNLKGGYDDCTPLSLAIRYLNPELKTLSILLSNHADFNATDDDGRSALTWCFKREVDIKFIDAVIQRIGANQLDNSKGSLLHYAGYFGTQALEYILGLKVLDVNGLDKNGFTPLHWIVFSKSLTIEKCRLLIRHGADVNIRNSKGLTPWAMANREIYTKVNAELLRLLKPTT